MQPGAGNTTQSQIMPHLKGGQGTGGWRLRYTIRIIQIRKERQQ